MGKDTHALSRPAERVALEVLAGNGIETFIQRDDGFTPTPVISHAILGYNRGRSEGLGDGIVVTPSHNPPSDGGFKYNPPNGGPADTDVTDWIQNRANELLRDGNKGVQRVGFDAALKAPTTHAQDFVAAYLKDLANVIDLEAIRSAGVRVQVQNIGNTMGSIHR
jgi:phosphoglucomutase